MFSYFLCRSRSLISEKRDRPSFINEPLNAFLRKQIFVGFSFHLHQEKLNFFFSSEQQKKILTKTERLNHFFFTRVRYSDDLPTFVLGFLEQENKIEK